MVRKKITGIAINPRRQYSILANREANGNNKLPISIKQIGGEPGKRIRFFAIAQNDKLFIQISQDCALTPSPGAVSSQHPARHEAV